MWGKPVVEEHRNVPLLRKYFASETLRFPHAPFNNSLTKDNKMELSVYRRTVDARCKPRFFIVKYGAFCKLSFVKLQKQVRQTSENVKKV